MDGPITSPVVTRALVLACLPRTGGRQLARVLASTGMVGSVEAHLSPRLELGREAGLARSRADVSANGTCSLRLRWPSVEPFLDDDLGPDDLFGVPTSWIVLTAEDRFAQAVAWDLACGHAATAGYDFPRLAGRFADVCNEEAAWDRWLSRDGVKPLILTREQVADDVVGAAREVLAHVGLPSMRPMGLPRHPTPDAREPGWTERFTADLARAARDGPSAA